MNRTNWENKPGVKVLHVSKREVSNYLQQATSRGPFKRQVQKSKESVVSAVPVSIICFPWTNTYPSPL